MKMFQRYGKSLLGIAGFAHVLGNAQFIDVSSVAQWFYDDPLHDSYDFGKELCSTSPFQSAWLEYQNPATLTIGKETRAISPFLSGMGYAALVVQVDIENGKQALEDDVMANAITHNRVSVTPEDVSIRRKELDALILAERFPRWLQVMKIFCELTGHRAAPMRAIYRYIDSDGLVCGNTTMSFGIDHRFTETIEATFMLGIAFLHCKNIKLEDVPVPSRVQKKREKKDIPNIVFKTLIVEPLRQQVRRETADDPTGEQDHIKRALHIARGHFKDYRNGPGLFGKYQGLYWWDMQIRGNADSGTIIKDYKIKR